MVGRAAGSGKHQLSDQRLEIKVVVAKTACLMPIDLSSCPGRSAGLQKQVLAVRWEGADAICKRR